MPNAYLVNKPKFETPKGKIRILKVEDVKRFTSFLMSDLIDQKGLYSNADRLSYVKLAKTFLDSAEVIDYRKQVRRLSKGLANQGQPRPLPAQLKRPPRKKPTIPYSLIAAQKKVDEDSS